MTTLKNLVNEKILTFDGAAGTSLIKLGLTLDDYHGYKNCHDYLCISRPDVVKDIHKSFLEVGCDIVETNSFGANPIVLKESRLADKTYEINLSAAKIAKEVAQDFSTTDKPRFVSGSIGPGSKLPSLSHISFDECVLAYYLQALGLIDGKVDLFQIETCQDLLQAKAAYIGVMKAQREKKAKLPVIVQVTVEKGKMLLGSDISAVVSAFSSFDLFALGLNCGTGPKEMKNTVRQLSKISPFEMSILPNAGLPKLIDGKPVYDLGAIEFGELVSEFALKYGASLVGGCCGTTPEHLKELVNRVEGKKTAIRNNNFVPSVSSLYLAQEIKVNPAPLIIGEKTNANGSKAFREALLSNNLEQMTEIALNQEREGAHVLDVCVAYAGRNEEKDLSVFIEKLNRELKIPLMIDSTNENAIEEGLKRIAGKAIINSINLEDGGIKAKKILEIAKKYGASVVCLTIDKEGMAKTKEKKLEIAERLITLCKEYDLKDYDIFIDFLTFTLGSGDKTLLNAGVETLNAINELKKKYPTINTILGVSNISYGLKPSIRKVLNSVFLFEAVKYGLTAAIFHAGKVIPIHSIDKKMYELAKDLIYNKRNENYSPLEKLIEISGDFKIKTEVNKKLSVEEQINWLILNGSKSNLEETLKTALRKYTGLEIINKLLLPSMEQLGKMFGKGEIQLPFVLKSAEVMKLAVDFLKPFFDKKDLKQKGSILLATVKGDVHDIGKNLVDIILSNNGFKVYNIGINISNEEIVEKIKKYNPDYLGLSGLLVKSAFVMKELLLYLNNNEVSIPVFIGGAALTKEYVETELREVYKGNVYYAKDAFDAVNIIERGRGGSEKKQISPENQHAKETTSVNLPIYKNLSLPKQQIPTPPFFKTKNLTVSYNNIKHLVNKKLLFNWKWKEKDEEKAKQKYQSLEKICIENQLFDFKVSYGYFKCKKRENKLILQNSNIEFTFEREKKQPYRCLTDYFREDEDILPLFLVTAGDKLSSYISLLYKKNKYELYYSFYHFANQLVEALAEYVHLTIKKELNIKENQGKRYSPGYSVWPELSEQKKILTLLNGEKIGVNVSETFQLIPEQSITAMVVHNKFAEYFSV